MSPDALRSSGERLLAELNSIDMNVMVWGRRRMGEDEGPEGPPKASAVVSVVAVVRSMALVWWSG